MATAPDQRAGRVSKTQRAFTGTGSMSSSGRQFQFHAGLADAGMHLSCKQAHAGATPAAGSILIGPVVQLAERLTLTQEVDGANPSGASILLTCRPQALK